MPHGRYESESVAERWQRLQRTLLGSMRKLERESSPRAVHVLRTSCRRLEALAIAAGEPRDSRLRRVLRQLRRKTNRLRDYDVQLAALDSLHLGSSTEDKETVSRFLDHKRARREKKLRDFLLRNHDAVQKQLRQFNETDRQPSEPLRAAHALSAYRQAAKAHREHDADALHALRIATKHARYLAEAAPGARARGLAAEFERLQDTLGDWRDWELLLASAEGVLAEKPRSPLLAVLRAQVRARYLHALQVREEMQQRLLATKAAPARKRPRRTTITRVDIQKKKAS